MLGEEKVLEEIGLQEIHNNRLLDSGLTVRVSLCMNGGPLEGHCKSQGYYLKEVV